MNFGNHECKDGDCFVRTPPNTISLWDCLREDYMLTHTGNRIYWGGSEPKGPRSIQIEQKFQCKNPTLAFNFIKDFNENSIGDKIVINGRMMKFKDNSECYYDYDKDNWIEV